MRTSTETYEHTINGLLQKRGELIEEMATTRERLAILTNDVEAIDRVLERLGYDGDIKLTQPTQRLVLFYRGELRTFLLRQLREHGPATSRQMAERLMQLEGKNHPDRRMVADVVKRVGRAFTLMRDAGMVVGTKTKNVGEYLWRLPHDETGA